ncbi:MAG TPA: phosphatase PAP2 family protein [Ktedonobacterales bacterium]
MELENVVEKRPLRQTFAAAVSAVIHPVAFPLLTLGVIVYVQTGSLQTALTLCLIAMALTTVPVAALVGYQVLRGHWTDLDVSVRQQRYALYPIGIACALLMTGVFVWMRVPHAAIAAALSLALANIVDGAINYAYKVSAHASAAAGCAALLWLFAPGWGVPATVAAALVGWSRVALGRHTTGQVLLGWLVGVVSALSVSWLVLV